MTFTARFASMLGIGLAFFGALLLPVKSLGGMFLVGFGCGMFAVVMLVRFDARSMAKLTASLQTTPAPREKPDGVSLP